MRITKSRTKHRHVVYKVELSEYDAEPPTRTWLLDDLPEKINPELEAVALYLVFGKWCGGEFVVPQKMGPNTAAAISGHAKMDFFPAPIEFYPKPIFKGSRAVAVAETLDAAGPNTLTLLDGWDWNGSLRSSSAMLLSSNTSLFDTSRSSLAAKVAPAVLLAEELDLGEIAVDGVFDSNAAELADLLRQVGVNLNVEERGLSS